MRPSTLSKLLLALFLVPLSSWACAWAQPQASSTTTAPDTKLTPQLWCEIARVVDADTIHVQRDGQLLKLRLLCVDTEERFHPGQEPLPGKPETVFGEECALWAEQFFAALGKDGAKPKIGLYFPGGKEEKDVFGRTLCHVILPDGSDYNLQLVREGKSPYFNKYGNSRAYHAAFVAAQAQAREQRLGIWNPDTNRPKDPNAPSAKRDYSSLLAWWNLRAQAIANFEARRSEGGSRLADAAQADAIEALHQQDASAPLQVFAELDKRFDEKNGELTLLLRTSDKQRALRLVVPKSARSKELEAFVDALPKENEQNFFYAKGTLEQGERGWQMRIEKLNQLQLAEPLPKR
jgi:micrococcal nuclease